MKKIISNKDLGIPYTNRFNRFLVDMASKNLGLDRLNELYNSAYNFKGVDFAAKVLQNLDVSTIISSNAVTNIPKSGPFIVIANHPHGALDGLLLADIVVRARPDTKFMGNFLLEKVEPMREMFLSVNPFNGKVSRNIPGIRSALNHLKEGNGLIIFPAGEVSTYYNGFSICEDKEWSGAIMKFIKRARVPVIPLYISGKNSRKFHFYGKIHPLLRTVRLPLELLNKKNRSVEISIGTSISLHRQDELKTMEQYRDYLRANVYYLICDKQEKIVAKESKNPVTVESIIAPIEAEVMERELSGLPDRCRLLDVGEYKLYHCTSGEIHETLKEICRLREIVFRNIGEGTNRAEDRDDYDKFYEHLFIWHAQKRCIVGAYRVGFGAKIMNEYGIDGFYTNSLFEYSSKFSDTLSQSIELGRSFVTIEFQKSTKPLMMLWQGIMMILLNNPQYRYLLGPVSMSNSYSLRARALTVNYIKEHCWNDKLAKMVIPRNGTQSLSKLKINTSLLKNIEQIGLIDKLIVDMDANRTPLPVLLRKYLQLRATVLSFNIDPNFNDSLDTLILLDIHTVPHTMLDMLSKDMKDVDVKSRFK